MLKNGHCVYLTNLRFEYSTKGASPTVTVYDTVGNHNKIATYGVELLTNQQDLGSCLVGLC
jgi:hypothetical protein